MVELSLIDRQVWGKVGKLIACWPFFFAPIAQLVEHRTFNPLVAGSIPAGGTCVLCEDQQTSQFSCLGEDKPAQRVLR